MRPRSRSRLQGRPRRRGPSRSRVQEYELNTETGHIAAADIIKESPDGADLWPAAHYGRVMLFIKDVPPKGPVGLISARCGGPTAGRAPGLPGTTTSRSAPSASAAPEPVI